MPSIRRVQLQPMRHRPSVVAQVMRVSLSVPDGTLSHGTVPVDVGEGLRMRQAVERRPQIRLAHKAARLLLSGKRIQTAGAGSRRLLPGWTCVEAGSRGTRKFCGRRVVERRPSARVVRTGHHVLHVHGAMRRQGGLRCDAHGRALDIRMRQVGRHHRSRVLRSSKGHVTHEGGAVEIRGRAVDTARSRHDAVGPSCLGRRHAFRVPDAVGGSLLFDLVHLVV